jgi:hypothetical protein
MGWKSFNESIPVLIIYTVARRETFEGLILQPLNQLEAWKETVASYS